MDREIIDKFKHKIHETGMGYQVFKDRDGKNKWNILCSATQWIGITIDGIDVAHLSRENTNDASIRMITFISCISTMWEAIQQLHRVLFSTNDIPFIGIHDIFNQDKDDNDYFDDIRACFSAHPINLKRIYTNDVNERWYASWSGGTFSGEDFAVFLYSNIPGELPRRFDISFTELLAFIEKRYQYLNDLMDKFDSEIEKYKSRFIKIPIEKHSNVLEQIQILFEENEKRLASATYKYRLDQIRLVYEQDFSDSEYVTEVVERYKVSLLPEIEEIYSNLQNMDLKDLETTVADQCPKEYQFAFTTLSDTVCGGNGYAKEVKGWIVETLNKFTSPYIELNLDMPLEKIYVLFKAVCYFRNLENLT